jgi:zinc D-Ala-D-Ala dipeptidase
MNRATAAAVVALFAAGTCAAREPLPVAVGQTTLVDATVAAPDLRLDVRYATPRNFTGRTLYPAARCLLRPEVAARLARAQAAARTQGYGLLVFDCYRPLSVQRVMWQLVPDERYVADPANGSRHNRGAAVDLTLVDAAGVPVAMPTDYDDFTPRAHRDYTDLPPETLANRATLERIMKDAGFTGLPTEWWHFDANGWDQYDVLDVPLK